jgi:two-component system chemotaxis sensor kinase CheA
MPGFDPSELLPFYLDETDEQIATLNDALLRLELDAADIPALQEAFRMFHSIKGAAVVMGYEPVSRLAHHLESLYEQVRAGKRTLDRPALDLSFRCLDDLRDYHRNLRAQGSGGVDLSPLTAEVVSHLGSMGSGTPPAGEPAPPRPPPSVESVEVPEAGKLGLTVIFEPGLHPADMKAKLVVNRLASRARIVATEPAAEQLEGAESLSRLTVWMVADCGFEELRALADVAGVADVQLAPTLSEGEGRRPAGVPRPRNRGGPEGVPTIGPGSASPLDPLIAREEGSGDGGQAPAGAQPPDRAAATAGAAGEPRKGKIAETIRVDSDRLDSLMNLAGELVINRARFVDIVKGLEELFRASNAQTLATDIQERLESISRGLETLGQEKAGTSGEGAIDRFSGHVRRVRDSFRGMADELGLIAQARERIKALDEAIHHMGRVTDGIQKGVLDTRMVPIGPLFERFRRVIRDLGHASGKEVVLRIEGETTELDKRMIDELSDPLIHMVRNAVDHGLETAEARQAGGKARAGTISLRAMHRGNGVMITVGDDGRGIDPERIRRKIVARGWLDQARASELPDRELVPYIWRSGFTTAETITEVSGRGVGMDIVKNRIENLNGIVDVRSVLGQGTTFTIRLPLTLAIMSSLLVRIYEEFYAVPLDHIDEIVEVRPDRIYRLQGQPAIEVRKKIIPLVGLGDLFRWGGGGHPSLTRAGAELDDGRGQPRAMTVVVARNGEATIGLLVDQLIGMQEVVLKSLEKNFRAVPGLSGASILGDGRVSLILDVDAVIAMAARAREAG